MGTASFQRSSRNLGSLEWALIQYNWGPDKGDFGDRRDSGGTPVDVKTAAENQEERPEGGSCALTDEHCLSPARLAPPDRWGPGVLCCPRRRAAPGALSQGTAFPGGQEASSEDLREARLASTARREGRKEFSDPARHSKPFLIIATLGATCFKSRGTSLRGTPRLADPHRRERSTRRQAGTRCLPDEDDQLPENRRGRNSACWAEEGSWGTHCKGRHSKLPVSN